jgi:hypothetical protein
VTHCRRILANKDEWIDFFIFGPRAGTLSIISCFFEEPSYAVVNVDLKHLYAHVDVWHLNVVELDIE